ncbi:helix-turn-helix domain-containing protein [Streptococcus uberis]|uniref:helix-turn-helix domain-containing protein n=1 Tax=Streptococcus TaxID=1301 RepID=UPI0008127100|nr:MULTISPECIES: helix-turn-helix transcriptional regulator [Streptococcus]MCK1167801.1 helix-turn-helix domain-containing protein [Streptococcus uberis]MCK1224222.1 helix-turn-helix domain-containing protein [Streptococcus uberis]MCK1251433.1 helix-turn-helix domain-containing protein [Streptococcus uberis]MCK1255446.1 helix-turn-helix domain-containing protein [Streptococcus uberis]SCA90703.1 transcriptional regulator, Cro/CI family [Streptococcus macedonicus]
MEFVERLKSLRKQAQLTQAQVAEKLNISQQGYGDWERGVKKPTQDNLIKIANLFNVSLDDLLGNVKEDEVDLSEVELLFRTTSKGMTEEEQAVFKDELIQFMKERKKLFDED